MQPYRYFPFADRWLAHHGPTASVFLATDDQMVLEGFQRRYGARLWSQEQVVRGSCVNASAGCAYSNAMSGRAVAKADSEGLLGLGTLVDTLLLSRCSFLVKAKSAVSEFAIYYSPRLINASFDFELRGQPEPPDTWWRPLAPQERKMLWQS